MPGGSPETTPERVLTGERTWPGIPSEMYWFSRHLACYEWAATKVATQGNARASILDAGAGEGYGSRVLADRTSGQVAGADLDLSTMAHLVAKYPEVSGGPRDLYTRTRPLLERPNRDQHTESTSAFTRTGPG